MARKYWFKPHKYSFGWAPASWEGWLVMLVYLGGLVYFFIKSNATSHSVSGTLLALAPEFLLLSGILICVTYLTGEPHSWKWKEREKSS